MNSSHLSAARLFPAFLLLLGLIAACGLTGAVRAADRLPFFDAHVHYNQPAWQVFDPAYVQEIFDRAGVTGALVGSTPDDGTLRLFQANPNRFVPELCPYRGEVTARNWTRDPGVIDYIKERLAKTAYSGIGEIHVYKAGEADWDVIAKVAAIAREKNIFLHVHAGAHVIERIFALEQEVTILWAHGGFYEPPEKIGQMLDKYDRLHAELSLRAPNVMPGIAEDITPEWKALFLRHRTRIVVGSDTYMNLSWAEYDEIIADHRRWLARLPADAARDIAHDNAARLFGRLRLD